MGLHQRKEETGFYVEWFKEDSSVEVLQVDNKENLQYNETEN